MMMTRMLLMAACLAPALCLAAVPDRESTAITLAPTVREQLVRVTLYPDGTNADYVCYYQMTLQKHKPYTVWLEDASGEIAIESASAKISMDWDRMEPTAYFERAAYGNQVRWVVSGEDWDYDDGDWSGGENPGSEFKVPTSWTYYIVVRGARGANATLHYVQDKALPLGILQNPLQIEPEVTEKSSDLTFYHENFFVGLSLTAGCRYYFATEGGTPGNSFILNGFEQGSRTNYEAWASADNASVQYVPAADMDMLLFVGCTNWDGTVGTLRYRRDEIRPLADHPWEALVLNEDVQIRPGYMNIPQSGFYDGIVDEQLFAFTAQAGKSYVIDTAGADEAPGNRRLKMFIYDARGAIQAANGSKGRGSHDVRCTLRAPAKTATYYVGVCEDIDEFDETTVPSYDPVQLRLREVQSDGSLASAVPLSATPGTRTDAPESKAPAIGPNALGAATWYNVYSMTVRKGVTYHFATTFANKVSEEANHLKGEIVRASVDGERVLSELDLTPGSTNTSFKATDDFRMYLRVSVKESLGLDYPDYNLHLLAYRDDGLPCGALHVVPQGCSSATWRLDAEKVTYGVGASIIIPAGTYTVNFNAVSGFTAPSARRVTVRAGNVIDLTDAYYSDQFDHKDDVQGGATAWTLKNTEQKFARTLWTDDPADYFALTGKDGNLYDFYFTENTGDAVMTLLGPDGTPLVSRASRISQFALPTSRQKYYLVVEHGTAAKAGGAYVLGGYFANVGQIKFAKTTASAKDTATSVELTVNRTAKDGMVRVNYTTVDDTAIAGEHYIAQSGVLEWASGDNKAKKITIKLIPKLLACYNGGNKSFKVTLEDGAGDYPADITGDDTAVITITESSKPTVTAESVYAKKAVKAATVKTSEDLPLATGTYYGVLAADEEALTNGLPSLASVTYTVTAATDRKPASFSAKVALAGKTYTFKDATGWNADSEETPTKTLRLVNLVNRVATTNELEVVFPAGTTSANWMDACAAATMRFQVPDENGKGVQQDVPYTGTLYRQNAKVQDYLFAVTNFTGYYTAALPTASVTATDGSEADPGVPYGNGYLTATVSANGSVKVAGMMPDATTFSASVAACGITPWKNAWKMTIPLHVAKAPYCFGGTLVLLVDETGKVQPSGRTAEVFFEADSTLLWHNDNRLQGYLGEKGWKAKLEPAGGWFDTVFNLQNYYKEYAQRVSTASQYHFPSEIVPTAGYILDVSVLPDGISSDLAGDTFSILKKALVKDGKTYDFELSSNPCNVQVKLARATGLVTGSLSLWSCTPETNEAGDPQPKVSKEISGFAHKGVLVQQRDPSCRFFSGDTLTGGALTKAVTLKGVDPVTGKSVSRKWMFSVPFNIVQEER